MTKIILFIITSFYVNSAFTQTCDSLDQRDMLQQLECFCNPEGKSIVKQKLDKIGSLSKSFGIDNSSDCVSSVSMTLALSKGGNVSSAISKKLDSLKYSEEQINAVLKPSIKQVSEAKLIQSQNCSKSSGTLTIGPFSFGGKKDKSPECEALSKLDPSELENANRLAFNMNIAQMLKLRNFTSQLGKLEQASNILDKYPEGRILKCLKLTSELNDTEKCLSSAANDEKIDSCGTLGMTSSSSIKCLQTKADTTLSKGCKILNMTETSTLSCLNISANYNTVLSCKTLNMTESSTIQCLQMNPDPTLASACKTLNMTETSTIQCLKMKPDVTFISACKTLNMTETSIIQCLQIKPDSAKVSACKNLNMTESSTLTCLTLGAQPEKIYQCGLKNLVETQMLDCIRQAFNESAANSQVNDSERSAKEKSQEDIKSPISTSGASGVSK